MRFDLNNKELELEHEFLDELVNDLSVEIINVSDDFSDIQKPFSELTFKVTEGIHINKILNIRFYNYGKAAFKMKLLAKSIGLGELGEDGKIHFPQNFDSQDCLHRLLRIDTKFNEYNGRKFIDIKKFYPLVNKKEVDDAINSQDDINF